MRTGVVLQTFPLADLPLGRSATLQTFPQGGRFATLHIIPLPLQIFPGGRSAILQTFPHFCNVPDSHFRMYWKTLFEYYINIYRLFKYVTINDKTILFNYVFSFSIKSRQVIWIYKDKTYNGWNDMGEALQWGKVCNGFSAPLQIFQGEGLQWG